nr:metalloregulator ArsR/SmtB family transcription factor [Glaciibacter superstes]
MSHLPPATNPRATLARSLENTGNQRSERFEKHLLRPNSIQASSDVFNAVAEPRRREILALLRTGERPVTELSQELGMSQPGASKHLRVLREIGLLRDRKAGKQRPYNLDARVLQAVHECTGGFEQFWNESFDRLDAYVHS